MADVTLTHKLRNPKSYNEWMDIWTATVHDPESQGASPKYEITPSEDWIIPGDRINNISVDKIIEAVVTPEPTEENPNPEQEIQKNTSIVNPEGNHIAITQNDGSIIEGPEIDEQNGSSAKFLNEQGQWIANNHKLEIQNYKLKYNDDNSYLPTFMLNGINSSGMIPIETVGFINAFVGSTRHSYEITIDTVDPDTGETVTVRRRVLTEVPTLTLMTNSIETKDIQNNAITPEKINWDYENDTDPNNPITMASTIKDNIGLNSSTNDGIVPATGGTSAAGQIWSADARGNPGWNDFSSTQWNKATDESLAASKLDTQLLGAVINAQKPILKLTSEELQVPDDSYYGTRDPAKWKTQSTETSKNIILKQEGNNSLTWNYMIEQTTKNWNSEDSQTLGYYRNLQPKYGLYSVSKALYYDLQLKIAINNSTQIILKKAAWNFQVIKQFRYPMYLVPSIATLDEYFNRINSFIETVTPLIKTSFEQYLTTTLPTKTISEINQIDLQEEMDRIVQSITANYPDNWSELVGIRNPDYSPNQLNDWDWKHLGIWIEI